MTWVVGVGLVALGGALGALVVVAWRNRRARPAAEWDPDTEEDIVEAGG